MTPATSTSHQIAPNPGARETALDDLAKTQRVTMEMIEGLGRRVAGRPRPHDAEAGLHRGDPVLAFTRLFRILHQAIVMQRQMTAEGPPATPRTSWPRESGDPIARPDAGGGDGRASPAPSATAPSIPVRSAKGAVKPAEAGPRDILAAPQRFASGSARASLLVGAAGALPVTQADFPPWRIPPPAPRASPAGGRDPPR